jgi:FkbM family methyltransferase
VATDFGVTRNFLDPVRIIRRELLASLGQELSVPIRLKCARARFGSNYGGWWIRRGTLGPQSIVYSVGIGRDISFDLSLIQHYGLSVHAFDPTRKCREWVSSQSLPAKLLFTGVGVAAYDGLGTFVLRSRPDWDSYELNVPSGEALDSEVLPVARVVTIMRQRGHEQLDVLKLDIESSEYDVIDDVLASGIDVRQLLVEFHYEAKLASQLARVRRTLGLLERAGYELFARSPAGHEFSFWRVPH